MGDFSFGWVRERDKWSMPSTHKASRKSKNENDEHLVRDVRRGIQLYCPSLCMVDCASAWSTSSSFVGADAPRSSELFRGLFSAGSGPRSAADCRRAPKCRRLPKTDCGRNAPLKVDQSTPSRLGRTQHAHPRVSTTARFPRPSGYILSEVAPNK
jgi:hypothetical protein